jgi:hypothetical protein
VTLLFLYSFCFLSRKTTKWGSDWEQSRQDRRDRQEMVSSECDIPEPVKVTDTGLLSVTNSGRTVWIKSQEPHDYDVSPEHGTCLTQQYSPTHIPVSPWRGGEYYKKMVGWTVSGTHPKGGFLETARSHKRWLGWNGSRTGEDEIQRVDCVGSHGLWGVGSHGLWEDLVPEVRVDVWELMCDCISNTLRNDVCLYFWDSTGYVCLKLEVTWGTLP